MVPLKNLEGLGSPMWFLLRIRKVWGPELASRSPELASRSPELGSRNGAQLAGRSPLAMRRGPG